MSYFDQAMTGSVVSQEVDLKQLEKENLEVLAEVDRRYLCEVNTKTTNIMSLSQYRYFSSVRTRLKIKKFYEIDQSLQLKRVSMFLTLGKNHS
jgi:hypothetical protein